MYLGNMDELIHRSRLVHRCHFSRQSLVQINRRITYYSADYIHKHTPALQHTDNAYNP